MNPQAPLAKRLVALNMLRTTCARFVRQKRPDGAMYEQAIHQAEVSLLMNKDLPPLLRKETLRGIGVDVVQGLSPDSAEALLLHYLLGIVANNADNELVLLAANTLEAITFQDSHAHPETSRNTYYFPAIVQTLEKREAEDIAQNGTSYLTGTLSHLQQFNRRQPQPSTITLHIPPLNRSNVAAQKIEAASLIPLTEPKP